MAPMEQVGEGEVANNALSWIQYLAQQERPLWEEISRGIPAWHPTNDGTDAGGDDGDGSGGDGNGDGNGNGSGGGDATQAAVDAAYAKLRAVEKERDKLKSDNTKLTRAGMDELERIKQELEDARLEAASLQEAADERDREKEVIALATTLKFKKPDKAMRFVGKDSKDTKAIKADLKEALEDFPELSGEGPPPPPVNDGSENGGKPSNARMNSVIRRMAGRS